uniref:Growth factor receptor bound protein 7 n=1 Tax=Calidris pygmaea TaxID=425635 RepID=A0A8C3JI12_9CHAR
MAAFRLFKVGSGTAEVLPAPCRARGMLGGGLWVLGRCWGDAGEMLGGCRGDAHIPVLGDAGKMLERCWGDAGGILGRCSHPCAGEMLGGCWGDAGGMLTSLCWGDAGEMLGGCFVGCPHPCARKDAGWVPPSSCGVDVAVPMPTLGGCGGPHPRARQVLPHPAVGQRPHRCPPPTTHGALHPPPQYGMQLYRNYQQAQARLNQPSWIGPTPLRSVSDNALVAMDFSGCTGRVIENPNEVLTVALEEAQAWRKKTTHRYSLPAACQSSPLSAAIHRTQPWFHGRISREDTQQLIGRQGLVDGVFLVRESQRNPKGFVLSLCHLQRVKHYLILPSEEEGRLYFTMDDGQTRFADLIQLVEFHQINRGILPCKLRHYCTCVAL